jgi:Glycosyl transferase family 2
MAGHEPPYFVRQILSEVTACKLTRVSVSDHPRPGPGAPILLMALRNEHPRLQDFLRHYRRLGVTRFAVVDNGSTDGGPELLKAQPDVDLYSCTDKFSEYRKLAWLNILVNHYGYDRWYLSVDADEHMVFEGSEDRSLDDLVALMESRKIDRVLAIMIDMYAEGPVLGFTYEANGALAEAFPLFDGSGYSEERRALAPFLRGGVRNRIFGHAHEEFHPLLTKFPLIKIVRGEVLAQSHFMWPCEKNFVSPRLIGLLHYKFLSDFMTRVNDAIARGIFYQDSFEYRCYRAILAENPLTAMTGPPTRRFRNSGDLLASGVIAPIDWPGLAG